MSAESGQDEPKAAPTAAEITPESQSTILIYDEIDPENTEQYYLSLEWTYS